jgi:oligosaccharide repeat unit polymerase
LLFLAVLEVPKTEFLIACLVLTLAAPSLARLCLSGRFDFFYPPTFFGFLIFIGHIFPLGDFLRGEDVVTAVWPYAYGSFENSLDFALELAILGAGSFFLGFAVTSRIPFRPTAAVQVFVPARMRLVGAVYTVAGLALFATGVVLLGGVSALIAGLADRIRAFAGLNYFFMAIFLLLDFALMWWAALLSKRRLFVFWFWTYFVFALALSSLHGSRAHTLVVVLAAVILYHLLYKPISLWRVPILLVIGAIALVAFQLIVREYLVVGELVSVETNPSLASLWGRFRTSLGSDFYQIQALTIVVDAVPDRIPFQYASTYLPLLLAPIPSSLWAGKLDYLTSPGVLTMALWPASWLDTGTTIPPSLMGEMYMNFGILGILVGMTLFGSLYGCAYSYLKRGGKNIVFAVLYAALVSVMIHYIRGELSAPTILLLFMTVPVMAAAWLVVRRERRPSGPLEERRGGEPPQGSGAPFDGGPVPTTVSRIPAMDGGSRDVQTS